MLNYTILLLNFIILAILCLIWKKTQRTSIDVWDIEARIKQTMVNEYRQTEALASLKWLINPKYPLPPTRSWAGSPDFLFTIAKHALDNKPTNILECSCGTSTIVLARCAEINGIGHVFSLENDPKFANQTREYLKQHGLDSFATIIDAPLCETDLGTPWYSLDDLPYFPIDMLIIDGPPAISEPLARFPAGPQLFNRLSPTGHVFLDDADREGERKIVAQWMKLFQNLEYESIGCEKGLVNIFLRQ